MGRALRPRLVLLGISFKTAPLAVRERVVVSPDALPQTLNTLRGYLEQAVLVSTCNRTELYFVPRPGQGVKTAHRFLQSFFGITPGDMRRWFYSYQDLDAVRHLFRVVCGLDSQAIGEAEVLGQVRHAFQTAHGLGMTGTLLGKVFAFAFHVARCARRHITLPPPSLAELAVEWAMRQIGKNGPVRALLVGAGETGTRIAQGLHRQREVEKLWIANRTLARAQTLAQAVGGCAIPLQEIYRALSQADVVFVAAGGASPLMTAAHVSRALAGRSNTKPLCIVDLAVPRGVASEVGSIPGVAVFTLDDLPRPPKAQCSSLGDTITCMQSAVEEGMERFTRWWHTAPALDTIAALHQWGESIRRGEVKRVTRYLRSLDSEGHAHLEAFSKALVRRLLQPVVEHLKAHPNPSTLRGVTALFGLQRRTPALLDLFTNGVREGGVREFPEGILAGQSAQTGGQEE